MSSPSPRPPAFCLVTLVCIAVSTIIATTNAAVGTFDDLTLAPESYWNGEQGSGEFASGPASFNNFYDLEWGYWEGFAYSSCTDANAAGYRAQYNAIPGSGQGGSSNYAVAFVGWQTIPTVTFHRPQVVTGLYVANNCYAFHDMRDGSPFAKKFGGPTGDDPDWFKLTITGFDPNDQPTGEIEFYLADLRFEDNRSDYILDSWAFVDLVSLGEIQSLQFTLSSSDNGDFGMNTPAYFCLDTILTQHVLAAFEDVMLAPESSWNGADGSGGFASGQTTLGNLYDTEWEYWDGFACSNRTDANAIGHPAQYNAIPGGGQGGTSNYAVAFVGWQVVPTLTFDRPQVFAGLYVTNNCYAFYEMRDGSPFAKKFGGPTADDPDWFKLTITGIDPNDAPKGQVDFYLADFRFEDNNQDYVLDTWAFVDLSSLGEVQSLRFTLSSSDNGDFGMNTPAYFCLDTIVSGVGQDEQPPEHQTGGDPCLDN